MNVETVTGNEQQEADGCEEPQDSNNTKVRVQRFRNSLREQGCGRLDVWIGNDWIEGLLVLSTHQKRPLWAVVQDAIKPYVTKSGVRFKVPPKDRVR
jgi:hypothetical protein